MIKNLDHFIIFLILFCSLNSLNSRPRRMRPSKPCIHEIKDNTNSVYKLVYDHYSDILEIYYDYEKSEDKEKDYYFKKLVKSIVSHVQQDKLPLYGNFFSKTWRNMTTCSSNTPIKKFDITYIEDALGHLSKHNNKLLDFGSTDPKIDDLIESLKEIRIILQNSIEYKYEELLGVKERLDTEITNLKNQLAQEKSKNNKIYY